MSKSIDPFLDNQPCPVCLSEHTIDFHRVDNVPVSVGSLCDTAEQARIAPVGDIQLSYCSTCQLVRNRLFDLEKVPFHPGYEVALNHSPVFREYLAQVAERLIERYELHGKTILEIGCGAGYFLRLICKMGSCNGIGIDPTVPQAGIEEHDGIRIEFIQDYFTEQSTDLRCDFICSLSVFEDVPFPSEFLENVNRLVRGRSDVGLYFEVFNAMRAFEQLETFSPHYEQCNYFGSASLRNAFVHAGFQVLSEGDSYQNGQYIFLEACPAVTAQPRLSSDPISDQVPSIISDFAIAHRSIIESWKTRLEQFQNDRRRVVLWGSGGKGITFLNELQITDAIPYVVDINPDRQEHFIPVTAQPIVAPEFLKAFQPDAVIITNPIYEKEIRKDCTKLEISPDFLNI